MNDRLSFIYEDTSNVVLVGYRRAYKDEVADLERGFPTSGRWRMDYIDIFDKFPSGVEWAKSVADNMWGTVYSDDGIVYADNLLSWVEEKTDDDQYYWSVRDKEAYESKCLQSFGLDVSTPVV